MHHTEQNIATITGHTAMQISNIAFLPVLCMSLFVPVAMAERLAVPDKAHRQGMSYEEYSHYREKMRLHMNKMHADERRQAPAASTSTPAATQKLNPNSAYGQGYRSREQTANRPDIGSGSRPEHPRGDRFSRGDTGRR
jgi:hypothetical protein